MISSKQKKTKIGTAHSHYYNMIQLQQTKKNNEIIDNNKQKKKNSFSP